LVVVAVTALNMRDDASRSAVRRCMGLRFSSADTYSKAICKAAHVSVSVYFIIISV
jgi:hypothetical protein